jgi:hypothetical protein
MDKKGKMLKKIASYLILSCAFLFFGCIGSRDYPSDLKGNVIPINTDDRYRSLVEKQENKEVQENKTKSLPKTINKGNVKNNGNISKTIIK